VAVIVMQMAASIWCPTDLILTLLDERKSLAMKRGQYWPLKPASGAD
jgi:hypothetical protein